jgi:hypothetical protein
MFSEKTLKDFEAASKALNKPATLPVYDGIPEDEAKWSLAAFIWQRLLQWKNLQANNNQPYWPNWQTREWKYWPWAEVAASADNTAGFGFSDSVYVVTRSASIAGSRLAHKTRQTAIDMQTEYADVFEVMMLR